MKYYGICPASCGEFVQGIVDRDEYLCSYAIDLYSTAEVEEKLNNINIGPSKSRKAIEAVFKKFNIPIEESKNISLKIKSKIPVGKGMASSTADIGATIGATLGLIKKELSNEEIANLASTIEPTDSIPCVLDISYDSILLRYFFMLRALDISSNAPIVFCCSFFILSANLSKLIRAF